MIGARNITRLFRNRARRRSMSVLGGIGGLGTLISTGLVVYRVLRNRNKNLV